MRKVRRLEEWYLVLSISGRSVKATLLNLIHSPESKQAEVNDETYVRTLDDGTVIPAEVRQGETVTDYLREYGDADTRNEMDVFEGITPGAFIRQKAVGNSTLDREQRSLLSGTDASGGFTVPAPLSSQLIDAVRNQTRVAQAGARVVPMTSRTLDMARVNGVPAGNWSGETAAVVEENITFERVTLETKNVSTLVKASLEFLEDSQESEAFIESIMAESIALAIDKAALYGDPAGAGDPDEPQGIKTATGIGTTAAVGTPANYDPFVQAIYALRNANFEPNSAILAPRDAQTLELLKDTTNQPLRAPESWANLRKLTTNQVDTDEGAGNDESTAFLGQWDNFLWGVRSEIFIRLDEHYIESEKSVGFVVIVRTDFQLARPNAFHTLTGILA